jgi:hypothetical protein
VAQKGDGGVGLFVGRDLRGRQARGVVDGDADVVPADDAAIDAAAVAPTWACVAVMPVICLPAPPTIRPSSLTSM